MSTGTIVVLSLVGVAAVGGVVYYVSRQKKLAAAAAHKSSGSTIDKVAGAVSALIPIGQKIAELWD